MNFIGCFLMGCSRLPLEIGCGLLFDILYPTKLQDSAIARTLERQTQNEDSEDLLIYMCMIWDIYRG